MNTILKGAALIGGLCAAWTFVMGFTGWYKHPTLLNAFWLVVPIQIGVLVWALRRTAPDRGYGAQVAAGTLISLLAGVLLFGSSLLFTTVVFPHYFEELQAVHAEMLKAAGKTEAEIATEVQAAAAAQTPFMQAFMGLIGTTLTGLVASLLIAIFARSPKDRRAGASP
ncbi:MAG TPA: DUF4199 domain-containing protein [Candidatus Nanopelagicales bacterium]|nr:DUF4199 domain-containing protein [Candidatus Nanopelagicales bacterium]